MKSSHSLPILRIVHMRAKELGPLLERLFFGLVDVNPRLIESSNTEMIQSPYHGQEGVVTMETMQALWKEEAHKIATCMHCTCQSTTIAAVLK